MGRRSENTPRVGSLDKDGQPKITERLFQEQVRKAAILTGWRIYHTWNSFRSTEGFPDCVLVHAKKKRMIVAELKSQTGIVSAKQNEWLSDFQEMPGLEVYVLRPSDFDWFWEILRR